MLTENYNASLLDDLRQELSGYTKFINATKSVQAIRTKEIVNQRLILKEALMLRLNYNLIFATTKNI